MRVMRCSGNQGSDSFTTADVASELVTMWQSASSSLRPHIRSLSGRGMPFRSTSPVAGREGNCIACFTSFLRLLQSVTSVARPAKGSRSSSTSSMPVPASRARSAEPSRARKRTACPRSASSTAAWKNQCSPPPQEGLRLERRRCTGVG